MKKKQGVSLFVGIGLFMVFMLWTVLVATVDKSPIGPNESNVGFSTLNGFVHRAIGCNMTLYTITDWLGLVPILVALGFAVLGLVQLIKRKSIKRVDRSIIFLGVFYIAVIAVYIFFEFVVINYRPVLIEGKLEASYPSSTTVLVMCVMSTALMQLGERMKNKTIRIVINSCILLFIAFMVITRAISGVHWISDIIGGCLISGCLISLYSFLISKKKSLAE